MGRGGTNPSGRGQRRSLLSILGGGQVLAGGWRGDTSTDAAREGRGEAVEERRDFYSAAERRSKYKNMLKKRSKILHPYNG